MMLQWLLQKATQFGILLPRMKMTATSLTSSSTAVDVDKILSKAEEVNASNTEKRHFLIVGLGNHGLEGTRHSVGMRAVDRLAVRLQLDWQKSVKENGGFVCSTVLRSSKQHFKITLLKPKAFMNINGSSVVKTAKALSIPAPDIFLVHDELEKNIGKFHLKEGGSAGGHKGVLSCMSCLRSNEMPRMRIGISRPASKYEIVQYVLSKFTEEELAIVDVTIDQAIDFLLGYIEKRISNLVTESTIDKRLKGKYEKQVCMEASFDAASNVCRSSDLKSCSFDKAISTEVSHLDIVNKSLVERAHCCRKYGVLSSCVEETATSSGLKRANNKDDKKSNTMDSESSDVDR